MLSFLYNQEMSNIKKGSQGVDDEKAGRKVVVRELYATDESKCVILTTDLLFKIRKNVKSLFEVYTKVDKVKVFYDFEWKYYGDEKNYEDEDKKYFGVIKGAVSEMWDGEIS